LDIVIFATCFVGFQSLEKLKSDPTGGNSASEPISGPSDPVGK